MNRVIHILFCLLISLQSEGYSLGLQEIRGIVLDASTGVSLSGARISDESEKIVRATDSSGLFLVDSVVYPFSFSIKLTGYDAQTVVLNAPVDSVLRIALQPRVFTLHEVVVTSTRLSQSPFSSPSSIRVIRHSEIDRSNATSLADLLPSIEGLFIKDYGSGSGAKTISQRGLGAEHTLILLNGMRISNTQNGLVDLGLIRVDGIDRVEVVRGGHSASFGADAVAGVINIVSSSIPARNTVRAASTVGSFGYHRYLLSGGLAAGPLGVRLNYGQERTDDDFPFNFHNGRNVQQLRRANSDLGARFGNINASLVLDDATELHTFSSVYRSERGVGGPVVGPSSRSRARQQDEDDVLQIGFSSTLPDFRLSTDAQVRYSYQRYVDPELVIGNVPLDNFYKNVDVRMEPKLEVRLSEFSRLVAGVEAARITAEGNSMKSKERREQFGAYVAADYHLRSIGVAVSELVFFPAVRYDAVGSDLTALSPQLGLVVSFQEASAGIVQRIRPALRASISRNFRPPTFNELFFNGGGGVGNPRLKAERSTSFDAGLGVSWAVLGEHQIQATYFRNDMTDRIVWVAAGAGSVTPKNLRNVRSEGFEGSYRWNLPDNLVGLEVNYTSAESRKTSTDYPGDPTRNAQLIYIPQETMNLSLSVLKTLDNSLLDQVGGAIIQSFVGYRYFTEDNAGFLPSYHVTNLNLRARFVFRPVSLSVKGEINNLFEEDYQVIIGYPMPLRSFRVTVGVEY